jgi:hypothetical protein
VGHRCAPAVRAMVPPTGAPPRIPTARGGGKDSICEG